MFECLKLRLSFHFGFVEEEGQGLTNGSINWTWLQHEEDSTALHMFEEESVEREREESEERGYSTRRGAYVM